MYVPLEESYFKNMQNKHITVTVECVSLLSVILISTVAGVL